MMRWHVLERWIKERGWTRGVEIGVFGGRTFLHLLESCPALTMIGVDTWTPAPEKQARYAEGGRSYESANLPALEREVAAKSAKFGERAILYKGDSVDVAQLIPDRSVDFVFIDADHLYEGVRADILAWRPKIKTGGVLCGHDYQPPFPGVMRAVEDLCKGFSVHDDTVWSLQVSD